MCTTAVVGCTFSRKCVAEITAGNKTSVADRRRPPPPLHVRWLAKSPERRFGCVNVGIIGLNAPVPAELLEARQQLAGSRGPDDGGTVILRDSRRGEVEIGLGNRGSQSWTSPPGGTSHE